MITYRNMTEAQNRGEKNQAAFILYLVLTAMVSGGLVMVLEILGSRVIGPFYGVSLFVWTSLITVTLVSLAVGYAAGGILSDRRGTPDYLYGLILIAGLLALLIPLTKAIVLKACLPLGLRSGALASSALLFGPPLFFLGCVSPYIIKIAAQEMKNIGRTVGLFYAVSTIGSFLGTVLTGFVLIAYFGVDKIFTASGIMLLLLSVVYFLLFRKKLYPLLFLGIPFLLSVPGYAGSVVMPDGTKVTRVFSKDSFYGNLKVVDYEYGETHTRELLIDGLIQGGIDMKNRMSVYEYSYFVEFLPYSLNPSGKSCLVIGLGAGVVPMWYEKMGIRTDVVDIDPNVVEIAKKYFGFGLKGEMIISDARYFLLNSKKHYDYIVLDVFNGDTTPGHILSAEALGLVKERLAPKGILAVNLAGSLEAETFMTASVIKTLEAVFESVDVYPTFSVEGGGGTGNLAVIAYTSAPLSLNLGAVRALPVHPLASEVVSGIMGRKFRFPSGTRAIVLSDNYNPIDFFDSWLKERVRRNILETTNPDILI
ncbi:MAG: fused MFS/spermidine synthase [Nitrospirae bacterium]|nr:fused MFS/spermidine synthase [Nitrospirota bacterium]